MTSRRIRSKVVQSTINNKDVLDMFHGVLGTGEGADLNLRIVHAKFLRIAEHCGRFVKLLEVLQGSEAMGFFPAEQAHLAGYAAELRAQEAAVFGAAPPLAALHPPSAVAREAGAAVDYEAVTQAERDAFGAAFRAAKESNLVNTAVVTCKNLTPHRKALESRAALSDKFLLRSGGLTFAPLPGLPAVNFKHLYGSDALAPIDRQFVMLVLHKLYAISHDVYEAMSAPDIDVEDFVHVILESLDGVKKHIPRCDEAFDKIRESVGLLKGNFGGYYKDYVASNNPTIIMENFVLDVSKSTRSSPRVTAQFRRIIGHYRKLAAQKAQHPKMQALFAQVDLNFRELDRQERLNEEEDEAPAAEGGEGGGGSSSEEDPEAAPLLRSAAEVRHKKNRKRVERRRRQKVAMRLESALSAEPPAAGLSKTDSPAAGAAPAGLRPDLSSPPSMSDLSLTNLSAEACPPRDGRAIEDEPGSGGESGSESSGSEEQE